MDPQTYSKGHHIGLSRPSKMFLSLKEKSSHAALAKEPLQSCFPKLDGMLASPRRISAFFNPLRVQPSPRPQFQRNLSLKQFHIQVSFLSQQHKQLPTSLQRQQTVHIWASSLTLQLSGQHTETPADPSAQSLSTSWELQSSPLQGVCPSVSPSELEMERGIPEELCI